MFTGDLSSWDVSSGQFINSMFQGASLFNSDISTWDVSEMIDADFMFNQAYSFDQNLNGWEVSSAEEMDLMFWDATNFEGAIYNWDIGSLQSGLQMLRGSGVTQENYDQILINWSQLPVVPNGIQMTEMPSFYCLGAAGRAILINTYGWNITDFGINCPGCTDPNACNYDASATEDDGSCAYIVDACGVCGGTGTAPGCTDQTAINFTSLADCDDESCIYGENLCGPCTMWDASTGQCITDPSCEACMGDLNDDGQINTADLLAFLGVIGTSCPE